MATTKQRVFDDAMALMGEPPVSSPDQDIEPVRVLRSAWDNVILSCLQTANWNHGETVAELVRLPDRPAGFNYAFQKPADWVRTVLLSPTGRSDDVVRLYRDMAGEIRADASRLWLYYISTTKGLDLGAWPQPFADHVAAELAAKTCFRITGKRPSEIDLGPRDLGRYRAEALAFDAQQNPASRMDQGRWTRARMGWQGPRGREGGQPY